MIVLPVLDRFGRVAPGLATRVLHFPLELPGMRFLLLRLPVLQIGRSRQRERERGNDREEYFNDEIHRFHQVVIVFAEPPQAVAWLAVAESTWPLKLIASASTSRWTLFATSCPSVCAAERELSV